MSDALKNADMPWKLLWKHKWCLWCIFFWNSDFSPPSIMEHLQWIIMSSGFTKEYWFILLFDFSPLKGKNSKEIPDSVSGLTSLYLSVLHCSMGSGLPPELTTSLHILQTTSFFPPEGKKEKQLHVFGRPAQGRNSHTLIKKSINLVESPPHSKTRGNPSWGWRKATQSVSLKEIELIL